MKLSRASVFTLLASWACTIGAVTVPGASTPLFYLVSTSASDAPNLLPLRLNGGTGGYSTLTGVGPIGKFYFYQGKLVGQDPAGTSTTYKALIGAIPASDCTTYGPLGFLQGSTSDKCALYDGFEIQSDTENSQLGAALVFNYQGSFYACGATQDVWYKVSSTDGPSGCSAINLYTVPVVT